MRLLLDTHAAIWLLEDPARMSERAVDHFAEDTNDVLLSAVVIWEIAVKRSMGKLESPADMAERLAGVGVRSLPITLAHAAEVEHLPFHHRDPFDRLLVAQARSEKATIISGDSMLHRYDVDVLW